MMMNKMYTTNRFLIYKVPKVRFAREKCAIGVLRVCAAHLTLVVLNAYFIKVSSRRMVMGFSIIEGLSLSGSNVGFRFLGNLGSWRLGVQKRKKLRMFGSETPEVMGIMMLQSIHFGSTMGISMHGHLMHGNPGTGDKTLGAEVPSLANDSTCFGWVTGRND